MHPLFYKIALSATALVTIAGVVFNSNALTVIAASVALGTFVIWLGDSSGA